MLSLNSRNDFLIEEYEKDKRKLQDALLVFFGNQSLDLLWDVAREVNKSNVTQLPQLDYVRGYMTHDKIIKQLDVRYWSKLMEETKFLNYVSSKERTKWNDQLFNKDVPEFNAENINSTLSSFMKSLPALFSQRLKDAHDALSRSHKTNKAQKLEKRMIFAVMYPDNYSWAGGSYSENAVGAINDIRSTISQILGGEQLNHYDTKKLLENISRCDNYGEWVKIDPYVAVRIYKKGTCHMEIHPRLLDQLNNILANGSLPDMSSDWYEKEEKKIKTEFHDLAFTSISNELRDDLKKGDGKHEIFKYVKGHQKAVDYILNTGLIPDFKSHQFYPTPTEYAEELKKYIPLTGSILEPSCGTGRLISGLESSRVTCLDISELFCKIVESQGYNSINTDFMKYDKSNKFDCIVMNPPYSKQRALLHIDKAKQHLNENGFILAIIPTGKITQEMEVLKSFKGGFDNTSINTSLVKIKGE